MIKPIVKGEQRRRKVGDVSIVSLDKLELNCDSRSRVSPYRELLELLLDSPKNSALRIKNLNARYSVKKHARALGYKVLFAEHEGSLYVKIAGILDEKEPKPGSLSSSGKLVLEALSTMPLTVKELARTIQADPASCEAVLNQLVSSGSVERDDGLGKAAIYRIVREMKGAA
jgi:hypothetical protein